MRGGDQAMYATAPWTGAPYLLASHARHLAGLLGWLFLLTHAALFLTLTGSVIASLLGALSVRTVRQSLGGEFWGFDGTSSVGTRTIMAILAPLVLLLPGWWALLVVVHPTTVWRFLRQRPSSPDHTVLRHAIRYRFGYLFYPIELRTLGSVAAHLSLPLGVWLWAGAPMAWLVLSIAGVALGGTAVIQCLAWLTNRAPVDIQTMRSFRLIYPCLGVGFAMFYATAPVWVTVIVFLASLLPPARVILVVKRLLVIPDPPPHRPGTNEDGEAFKAGALAYLQGPGAFVDWYRSMCTPGRRSS